MSLPATFTLNDGATVPVVGLGTFHGQDGNSMVKEAVKLALKLGYRHIDGANAYGNEKEIGEAIKESAVPRKELFVTSKLAQTWHDPGDVERALDISLKDLQLKYVSHTASVITLIMNDADDLDSFNLPSHLHPPDYDLSTCIHPHTLLGTAGVPSGGDEDDEIRPVPVTLYHWSPPSVRAILTVVMPPGAFRAVEGYVELGEFKVVEYVNLSKALSEALVAEGQTESEMEMQGKEGLTREGFAGVIRKLDGGGEAQGREALRFFTVPVMGKGAERAVDRGEVVWRWSKPGSAYRKSGRWGRDLKTVLEEGEWSAGRGFGLLVKGAEEGGR